MQLNFGDLVKCYRKSLRKAIRKMKPTKRVTEENHNILNHYLGQDHFGTKKMEPPRKLKKPSWPINRIKIEAEKLGEKELRNLQGLRRDFGKGKTSVRNVEISQLTISNFENGRELRKADMRFYVCVAIYGGVVLVSDVVEEGEFIKFESLRKMIIVRKDFKILLKFYRLSIDEQITKAQNVKSCFEPCGETWITPETLNQGYLECVCGNFRNLLCVTAKVS